MKSSLTKTIKQILPKPVFWRLRLLKNRWRRSVSQFGQDFWVLSEVFNEKESGFFLDIGAAGGNVISNTLVLEKRYHWRGICIEATPEAFKELSLLRNATCINCCVDDREGEVQFREDGFFSGIVDKTTDQGGENQNKGGTVTMKTRPLKAILDELRAPKIIDYLSIDVEGAEDRILTTFPYSEYRFLCITIERPKPVVREVLKNNGYILIKEIPGFDCFYLHESFVPQYQKNIMEFWAKSRR